MDANICDHSLTVRTAVCTGFAGLFHIIIYLF